ncbi:MAG: 3-oxoacyl-ACP reductase FabG [Candidatus Gracilibacteria bacterium]|nr:3-oxoacyl-ACP reductase FabG [Candidatus Gracilibacteria bacterium]
MRLKDKVALITGASKGIGKATALLFAREGAIVIVNYFSSEKEAFAVVEKIKENKGTAIAIKCDVSKVAEVNKMVQQILNQFKRIDILVNNAGVLIPKSFDETDIETWNKTIESNLLGTYNCLKAVSKEMKKQKSGKIVNVSSIAAIVGSLTSVPYAASKAGINAITKTLAPELGKFNITINSVAPGPVDTDLMKGNYSQAMIDKLAGETPLGRIALPEDIARAILFFSSEDSDFVNGQTLIVDGGRIVR